MRICQVRDSSLERGSISRAALLTTSSQTPHAHTTLTLTTSVLSKEQSTDSSAEHSLLLPTWERPRASIYPTLPRPSPPHVAKPLRCRPLRSLCLRRRLWRGSRDARMDTTESLGREHSRKRRRSTSSRTYPPDRIHHSALQPGPADRRATPVEIMEQTCAMGV